MDQSLNRVVARGVRPHFSHRNMHKVTEALRSKKIKELWNLGSEIRTYRRALKSLPFNRIGSDTYYEYKSRLRKAKARSAEIKNQEWVQKIKEKQSARNGSVTLIPTWR